MIIRLVYWYSQRAGNDGRRPSGNVYQRTKYRHYIVGEGDRTLCNREINLWPSAAKKDQDIPICKVCEKRFKIRFPQGSEIAK